MKATTRFHLIASVIFTFGLIAFTLWAARFYFDTAPLVKGIDTIKKEECKKVTVDYCEFVVTFPHKVSKTSVIVSGHKTITAETTDDRTSPRLKATFLPFSQSDDLRGFLAEQAAAAGIPDPRFSIKDTKIGTIGNYSGKKTVGGKSYRLYGKVMVGEKSMLHLLISEPSESFPSPRVNFFLGASRRK